MTVRDLIGYIDKYIAARMKEEAPVVVERHITGRRIEVVGTHDSDKAREMIVAGLTELIRGTIEV